MMNFTLSFLFYVSRDKASRNFLFMELAQGHLIGVSQDGQGGRTESGLIDGHTDGHRATVP